MNNMDKIEIGSNTLPLGHSLILEEDKPKRLVTFSMPRSSLFESLNSFLPQFKQSCEDVEREIAETGTTQFAVEELVSDSDSSSEESEDSQMSVEGEESKAPTIEMRLAVAPMETVELIEQAENELSELPSETKSPLVKEM